MFKIYILSIILSVAYEAVYSQISEYNILSKRNSYLSGIENVYNFQNSMLVIGKHSYSSSSNYTNERKNVFVATIFDECSRPLYSKRIFFRAEEVDINCYVDEENVYLGFIARKGPNSTTGILILDSKFKKIAQYEFLTDINLKARGFNRTMEDARSSENFFNYTFDSVNNEHFLIEGLTKSTIAFDSTYFIIHKLDSNRETTNIRKLGLDQYLVLRNVIYDNTLKIIVRDARQNVWQIINQINDVDYLIKSISFPQSIGASFGGTFLHRLSGDCFADRP